MTGCQPLLTARPELVEGLICVPLREISGKVRPFDKLRASGRDYGDFEGVGEVDESDIVTITSFCCKCML
jgi:hypothetical protein